MEGGEYNDRMLELKRREVEAAERLAVANEQLIELATAERIADEQEPLPPCCPHCGQFDPQIRNEGGIGPLSEFVLVAHCSNCSRMFLAVPATGWAYAKDANELQAMKGGIESVNHS